MKNEVIGRNVISSGELHYFFQRTRDSVGSYGLKTDVNLLNKRHIKNNRIKKPREVLTVFFYYLNCFQLFASFVFFFFFNSARSQCLSDTKSLFKLFWWNDCENTELCRTLKLPLNQTCLQTLSLWKLHGTQNSLRTTRIQKHRNA